jgi:hypothetical protein
MTPKPQTYNSDLRKLPRALAYLGNEKRWLCWKWEWNGKKWTKPPYRADDPEHHASTSDPSTWGTYQMAVRQVLAGKADGIGIALKDLDLGGIDLDHCRNPDTSEIAPWAQERLRQFPDAYAEATVSGCGLRILGTSDIQNLAPKFKLPDKGNGAAIELFSNSTHYLTVSGNEITRCRSLPPIGKQMAAIAAELGKRVEAPQGNGSDAASPQNESALSVSTPWSFAKELQLRSALAAIPADEKILVEKLGSSHNAWVAIGMAIERLGWDGRGYAIFRDWSMQSKEYNEEGLRKQWRSFQQNRNTRANPVTIGTVFHYARQFGWIKPQQDQQHPERSERPATLPEPIDLWAQFDPPELPRDVLPPIIEQFARERGEIMGADPAGLAMSALTVCAAAIPARIKLQVKKHDQAWKESARLWVALIGLPSTKKTPIMREAAKPLVRMDTKLFQRYMEEKIRYDALPADERRATRAPKQERLRIEDATIESAQEVLRDSPEGALCWQDELSGWFGSMDKYVGGRGAAKDRGFWLQAYNGGSYALNRIGRGVVLIPNLDIDVLGGIQPDVLRKVLEDTVDDGLIQRLHPLVLRPATESMDIEPTPIVTIYADLVEKLRNASSTAELILHFDDGAQAVRQRLERKHLALAMSCERINKKLAAHLGKYDGVFARLCLIWHCIEHAEEDTIRAVSEDTALRVERFLHSFLFPHALAFYAGILGLADDHDRLAAVAGYVLAHKLTEITNRDIARSVRSMRRLDKRETSTVFEQLESLGWLLRTPAPRPTDPWHWRVNPRVHELFAELAKHEAERREQDREMLATLFAERREQKQWCAGEA